MAKYKWKFLRERDGKIVSKHGKLEWKIGEWQHVDGKIQTCGNGLHCSDTISHALSYVKGEVLAKVEVKGESSEKDDKSAWSNMRIVTAYKWTDIDSVKLAVYAAEQVIDIYEAQYPKDKRPRKAIEAAKKYIYNPTKKNSRAAAYAAADAAAYAAADAAADAATDAAAYAAYAATDAAAYAADAADAAADAAAYAADAADAADAAAYAAAYAAYAADAADAAADAAAYAAYAAYAADAADAAADAAYAADAAADAAYASYAADAARKKMFNNIEKWLKTHVKELEKYDK